MQEKDTKIFKSIKQKKIFSDKIFIEKYIEKKNKDLSKNWKVNIIKESLNLQINKNANIKKASINSKKINPNDLFFGIKGKNLTEINLQ